MKVDLDLLLYGYLKVQSVLDCCDSERFPLPLFTAVGRVIIAVALAAVTQSAIPSLRTVLMSDVRHDLYDDNPQTFVAHVLDAMHGHA